MYIQYVGFDGTAGSRLYGFHLIDAPREPREFTVKIHAEAFAPSGLRFQDGPDICFMRLKKGLLEESQGVRAEAHLNITEQDVRAYLEAHRSAKKPGRGRGQSLAVPNASLDRYGPNAPEGPERINSHRRRLQ